MNRILPAAAILLTGLAFTLVSLVYVADWNFVFCYIDPNTSGYTVDDDVQTVYNRGFPLPYLTTPVTKVCAEHQEKAYDMSKPIVATRAFLGDWLVWSLLAGIVVSGIPILQRKHALLPLSKAKSKAGISKNFKILITGAVVALLPNVVPLPRGPILSCSADDGDPFAQQSGFPFVYLQRSISPSACSFSGETAEQTSYSAEHRTYVANAVTNVTTWVALLGMLYLWLNWRKIRGTHE